MPDPETPPKYGPESITVRTMRAGDLERVVEIDTQCLGRDRTAYLDRMLQLGLRDPSIQIILVAEAEGRVIGFAGASLFYGDFGLPDPSATLDVIAVARSAKRRNVGTLLMRHLRATLTEMNIGSLRLELEINQYELMSFLQMEGFRMSPRVCMEMQIGKASDE